MLIYKKGDVTKAKEKGIQLLVHCCNSIGIAGSGVVVALRKAFPGSMEAYEQWYQDRKHRCPIRKRDIDFELGEVQFFDTGVNNIMVCNCIGQKSPGLYKSLGGVKVPPVRLWAMREAMITVADFARHLISIGEEVTIIGPKFCSERAGADWDEDIIPIIEDVWQDLNVVIYEYVEEK